MNEKDPWIKDKIISAPSLPEKSALDLYEKSINKPQIIEAQGELYETIACLEMISKEFNIPFRKDTVEKIIRDELRRKKTISLDFCGGIFAFLGLIPSKSKISCRLATRLPTPTLIYWKDSIFRRK